jgi:peroxiredoxin
MHPYWLRLFAAAFFLGQVPPPTLADGRPMPLQHFELRDSQGRIQRLNDWQDRPVLVLAFLGVDCPVAKLYSVRLAELARQLVSRGVAFVGIDANQHDSPADIAQFAAAHQIPFPVLCDPTATVADQLGVKRIPEVVVLDEQRFVRYRGRVDDQYTISGRRAEPTRRDLAIALEELLSGRPVSQPRTPVSGCLIDRSARSSVPDQVTYSRDIAPILQRHCLACHRPGQMAPFALTTYRQVAKRADRIREAVQDGRMPPWHADPHYGKFANNLRLTDRQKQLLEDWVQNGHPEGDRRDQSPPGPSEGWNIPGPDLVVSIPRPFTVPATGVVEYQLFEVDPGFREDRWIRGAEIRPSNRQVVHHCNVFLKHPHKNDIVEQGALGSFCLAAMAVGTPPLLLPEGMAKRIPAGWRLVFVVHYTPTGSVQTDQTSLGLVFADPKKVRKEVATKVLLDMDLCIPPHASDHRVEHTHRFDQDVLLLAMFPHMHLRGKSFRYEAAYPNGSREILLDVPRFDFNWQNRYELAEPKRLPAGTTLHCIAHYDNSATNSNNPDPDATVHTGQQSWDEMFNGYFEFALAEQDLTRHALGNLVWHLSLASLTAAGACCVLVRLRRRRPLTANSQRSG